MNFYLQAINVCGRQPKRFMGIQYNWSKPLVDLISLHIVDENGKELFLLSRDFNIDWAWKRLDRGLYGSRGDVFMMLYRRYVPEVYRKSLPFNLATMRWIRSRYGLGVDSIVEEVMNFTVKAMIPEYAKNVTYLEDLMNLKLKGGPVFWAYNSDSDWIGFSQLFGGVRKLPVSYPRYCLSLKQELMRASEVCYRGEDKPWFKDKDVYEISRFIKGMVPLGGGRIRDAMWVMELHDIVKRVQKV